MKYYNYTLHPDSNLENLKIDGMVFTKNKPIKFLSLNENLKKLVNDNILQVNEVDTDEEDNFFYISPKTKKLVQHYSRNRLFQKPISFIYDLASQIGIPTHTEKNIPKSRDFLIIEILKFQENYANKG